MQKQPPKLERRNPLYERGLFVGIAAFVLSLMFHFISLERVASLPDPLQSIRRTARHSKNQVKIRIADKKSKNLLDKKLDENNQDEHKQIVETPLAKTEKPKDAKALGVEDHSTQQETRIEPKANLKKGLDAGEGGVDKLSQQKVLVPPKQKLRNEPKTQDTADSSKKKPRMHISDAGEIPIKKKAKSRRQVPRNNYEKLLDTAYNQLEDQVSAGYQEYLDESYKVGNHIDINTTSYRYIGYFSGLRKAIELVWNYPTEASQRGMQGKVTLEFLINLDGSASKIRVLKSSGYSILDTAIVDAIRIASPFSPLPSGMAAKPLYVKGSFIYQLQSIAH